MIAMLCLLLSFSISAMDRPDRKLKCLISQDEAAQFTDINPWLSIPRLTFMALLVEAHRNNEPHKKSFRELFGRLQANAIGFDQANDAFKLSPSEFYNGLLQYIPWNGQIDQCVIPKRYKIQLNGTATPFTLGISWHVPNQIEAYAIETLSPDKRQELIQSFNAILRS